MATVKALLRNKLARVPPSAATPTDGRLLFAPRLDLTASLPTDTAVALAI